eukprot:234908-Pelagomonas_calceolata.AAC.1
MTVKLCKSPSKRTPREGKGYIAVPGKRTPRLTRTKEHGIVLYKSMRRSGSSSLFWYSLAHIECLLDHNLSFSFLQPSQKKKRKIT